MTMIQNDADLLVAMVDFSDVIFTSVSGPLFLKIWKKGTSYLVLLSLFSRCIFLPTGCLCSCRILPAHLQLIP